MADDQQDQAAPAETAEDPAPRTDSSSHPVYVPPAPDVTVETDGGDADVTVEQPAPAEPAPDPDSDG